MGPLNLFFLKKDNESLEYLLCKCSYSTAMWEEALRWQWRSRRSMDRPEELNWVTNHARGKSAGADVFRLPQVLSDYALWHERNMRIFQQKRIEANVIVKQVVQDVHIRRAVHSRLQRKLASSNYYP